MNKFKRVFASLTLLVFMFVTFSFNVSAAGVFSDVDPSYQYSAAIEKLYNDKIVDGYLAEDGSRTYLPENTITRAEFSKLLAVSLVADQSLLAATPTNFADVDNDEKISWAIPYISYAVQSKIVNGYEDKSFRPFNEVTYAEAVKMIVCALGYGDQVEATTPWYDGYMKIAKNIGALNNALADANTPAKRGLVAQLIVNMLDVQKRNNNIPIVVPGVGGGDDSSVTIVLPEDDEEIYEDEGQITAVFDYTLVGTNLGLNKKQIMIDGEKYTLDDSLNYETYVPYLGYECDFEYIEENHKNIIRKITMKNDYTTYEFKDEENIENITPSTFEFYKDGASKTTKLNVANLSIIYNGYGTDGITPEEKVDLLTPDNGSVILLDNGDNKTVDVAFVNAYETYFVGSVALDTCTIFDKNLKDGNVAKSIVLDDSSDNIIWKTDKGVDSAITSLTRNTTTISVAGPYPGQNYDGLETETNVIVSKKTAKGIVESYNSATDEYTIAGKPYKVSSYYNEMIEQGGFDDQRISVGDSGTYYLDYANKIVYVSVKDSSRYGYITSIIPPDNPNKNEYIINMVSNTGNGAQEPAEYTLKDKITINGETYDFDEVADRLALSAAVINADRSVTSINAEHSQPVIFETTLDGGTIIRSIQTVAVEGLTEETESIEYSMGVLSDEETRANYPSTFQFKYGSTSYLTMKFGSTATNPTKVFVVPNDRNDTEDYAVYTTSTEVNKYFTIGNTYLVEGFNVSSSKIAEIVVVYGSTPLVIDGRTPAYIVESVQKKMNTEEDEQAFEFTMYQLGVKEPPVTVEITKDRTIGADINPGDIIKFAKRGNYIGAIEKVLVNGDLYEPFNSEIIGDMEQEMDDDYQISGKYSTTPSYFNAHTGIVYLSDESVLQILPGFETTLDDTSETYEEDLADLTDSIRNFTTGTSTYVIIYDGTANAGSKIKFVNTQSLTSISEHGLSNASRIFLFRNSTNAVKSIVIYKNMDFIQ